MRYCSFIVFVICFCLSSSLVASESSKLWHEWSAFDNAIADVTMVQKKPLAKDLLLTLDVEQIKVRLQQAVDEQALSAKKIELPFYTLELPLPDGSYKQLVIEETQTLSLMLQQKFPNVRTYKVSSLDGVVFSGRIELSSYGFHAMLYTATGDIAYIDPVEQGENVYRSYWGKELAHAKRSDTHQCILDHDHAIDAIDAIDDSGNTDDVGKKLQQNLAEFSDASVYKYRLAVSATGEYTAQHGGTKASALAAIASTINRINHIYERDTAIHFELVANNDQLIFTDASTDPFSGDTISFLQQNQTIITDIIGNDNYDIGHLFTTRGGGLALVGGACRANAKARGVSGHSAGDRFDLAFVAHEIGHQFGATHTFSGTEGLCLERNRTATTAYEPGSGSTIMSYAGICGSDNVQDTAEPLFHIGSIQQIQSHKQNQWNQGCGEIFRDNFNLFRIDAGIDYVIPANTPFLLKGETITQGDEALVYNWQQIDSGIASAVNVDTGDNALFRTFLPTASSQRFFPRLAVLFGEEQAVGELLPKGSRVMNFQFVAQDLQGVTISDAKQIRVHKDAQQFGLVTINTVYQKGVESMVLWEVANTHLPPVSCAAVDIALSLDNGQHFDLQLASNVANTGFATIVIPVDIADVERAYFKLSCSDNIFFSVSKRLFAINNNRILNVSNSNQASSSGGGSFSIGFLLSMSITLLIIFGRKCSVIVTKMLNKKSVLQ